MTALNKFINYWDNVTASWFRDGIVPGQQQILDQTWLNLSREHMPEPYWGNPENCSIVIANYNPGGGADRNRHAYLNCADWEHTFINEVKNSKYSKVALNFPIIDEPNLNDSTPAWWEDYGGGGWWRDKRDWLEDDIINNENLYGLLKDIITKEPDSLWEDYIRNTKELHNLLKSCIDNNVGLKQMWQKHIENNKNRNHLWQDYIENNKKLHRSLIDYIKVKKELHDLLKDCIKDKKEKIEEYKSKVKKPFAIEFCGWHSKSWPGNACKNIYEDENLKPIIDEYFIDILVEAVKCSDLKLGICIGKQLYDLLDNYENAALIRCIDNASPEYYLRLFELKGKGTSAMILSIWGSGRNRFPNINQNHMETVRVKPSKMQK